MVAGTVYGVFRYLRIKNLGFSKFFEKICSTASSKLNVHFSLEPSFWELIAFANAKYTLTARIFYIKTLLNRLISKSNEIKIKCFLLQLYRLKPSWPLAWRFHERWAVSDDRHAGTFILYNINGLKRLKNHVSIICNKNRYVEI